MNEGRYAEARPYSQKSLSMKERLLDRQEHQFEFFISKLLLAMALLSDGSWAEALAAAQDAIAHVEREKGSDNLYTRNYMFHVANVWANVGNFAKAAEQHNVAVKARIGLFGKTSHDTLNGYYALALCLYKIGKHEEAR